MLTDELADVWTDCSVTISIQQKGNRRPLSVTSRAESLLVVGDISAQANAAPEAEPQRKKCVSECSENRIMRDALEPVLALVKTLPREELPRLLGDLTEISATAGARLTSSVVESHPNEMLDVEETARRMGVSKDYLYRHQRKFSFARRIGHAVAGDENGSNCT